MNIFLKKASRDDLLKFKQSLISNIQESVDEISATVTEEEVIEKPNNKPNFIDKALAKEKLSVEEQIAYLKYKGIKFNLCDEPTAKDILANRTYYYKVTAFRKNFNKNEENKFLDVDFGLLNDLATIDMHVRYLFLKLSLDIEHNLKSLIIRLLTESDEDGYKIIDEYISYEIESYRKKLLRDGFDTSTITSKIRKYKTIDKKLMHSYRSPRDYSYDLINKRKDKPSIWVIIELMSYGQLYFFIDFYVKNKKYKYKELKLASILLLDSKNIRDSSAHSRPILFNIIGPNQFLIPNKDQPKLKVREYLKQKCRISDPIINIRTRNLKIHDISALLYLHDYYVKGSITRIERKKELVNLFKRCRLKKSNYDKHQEFGEVLYMLIKIIRNYKVKS